MSSSATLESIPLQAGGLNVTLQSKNNSHIPQDVVESTTAAMHEIAQLLASGPNLLLPVEYRQAQYDVDLYKLIHKLMSAGQSESVGTQQRNHLTKLEKDEGGMYQKLVSVLQRRNELSPALEQGKKLAELNAQARAVEEHGFDDDAAEVNEMLLDPNFSISHPARSPSPVSMSSEPRLDSSPPATPPPPTSSPVPSSPAPLVFTSSQPEKRKRTRMVVDVSLQRRKPSKPEVNTSSVQRDFLNRMIQLRNSLHHKFQHKLDITTGTLPHNRVEDWDLFPNVYSTSCTACHKWNAKCEIGDKNKPGSCRLCVLRQIACSNYSPNTTGAVGPRKRKRVKHKIILDPKDEIPKDETAELDSKMQQSEWCSSADTTRCRKDHIPMDEDKPLASAQAFLVKSLRDDSYNVKVPTSEDFLRVDTQMVL